MNSQFSSCITRTSLLLLLFAGTAWGQASPAFDDTSSVWQVGYTELFNNGSAGVDSIKVAYPNCSSGDIVFLHLSSDSASTTYTTPSGWAEASWDTTLDTEECQASLYWWRSDGTYDETTDSLVVQLTTNGGVWGQMSAYSGAVSEGTPYEQFTVNKGFTSSATSSEITPTTDYTLLLIFATVGDNGTFGQYLNGWTLEWYTRSSFLQDGTIAGSYKAQTTAATEPARTNTISGGPDAWITYTLALKSEGASGTRRSNVSN